MSVRVYVGPVTRYLLGEWSGSTSTRPETSSVQRNVQHLFETLDTKWEDTLEGPCRVETISLDDYGRIMLAAAYSERPDLKPKRRQAVAPSTYASTEAYSLASHHTTRYRHLLAGVDWWLPTHTHTREIREVVLNHTRIRTSSVSRLVGELSLLNVREVGITSQDFTRLARQDGQTSEKDPLKRAVGTLLLMARLAESRQLPLILDVNGA